jgi:type IV pilus assembly protein PilB
MNIRALRARHFSAEEVDLSNVNFTEKLLACVPAEIARQCRVLPVFDGPDSLKVAMADPSDIGSIDLLRSRVTRDLQVCVADEKQLDEFIDRLYHRGG